MSYCVGAGTQTPDLSENLCAVILIPEPSLQHKVAQFLIRLFGIFISGRKDFLVCVDITLSYDTWLQNVPSHPAASFPPSWSFPVSHRSSPGITASVVCLVPRQEICCHRRREALMIARVLELQASCWKLCSPLWVMLWREKVVAHSGFAQVDVQFPQTCLLKRPLFLNYTLGSLV